MKFKKPIVFFDLETTGLDVVSDRICQIGAVKILPDGTVEEKKLLINPIIPIPAEATEVHKITDEMVNDAPKFVQVAKGMKEWFSGCDIGGYNSDNFDIPLLAEEFYRCGVTFPENKEVNFVDVLKLEREYNSHKLENAYKRYTGLEFQAHDALEDIKATVEVFKKQVESFNIETDAGAIDEMLQGDKKRVDFANKIYEKDNKFFWTFGKNKDKEVKNDKGYCEWVCRSNFSQDTKKCIKEILE